MARQPWQKNRKRQWAGGRVRGSWTAAGRFGRVGIPGLDERPWAAVFGLGAAPSAGGAARDAAVAALETEVRLLRQMLDDMRAERADLKADRDAWKGQAERLALAPPRRPWWPW